MKLLSRRDVSTGSLLTEFPCFSISWLLALESALVLRSKWRRRLLQCLQNQFRASGCVHIFSAYWREKRCELQKVWATPQVYRRLCQLIPRYQKVRCNAAIAFLSSSRIEWLLELRKLWVVRDLQSEILDPCDVCPHNSCIWSTQSSSSLIQSRSSHSSHELVQVQEVECLLLLPSIMVISTVFHTRL